MFSENIDEQSKKIIFKYQNTSIPEKNNLLNDEYDKKIIFNKQKQIAKKKISNTQLWTDFINSTNNILQNQNQNLTHNIQLFYLQQIIDAQIIDENKMENYIGKKYLILIINELKKKISGYKQQDIKKHIYDKNNFCNINDTIKLLQNSNLICNYCLQNIKIIYDDVKDPLQWTLDRINNDLGHIVDNLIICCLKCNLKRRKQILTHFDFTEKIKMQKIVKLNDVI